MRKVFITASILLLLVSSAYAGSGKAFIPFHMLLDNGYGTGFLQNTYIMITNVDSATVDVDVSLYDISGNLIPSLNVYSGSGTSLPTSSGSSASYQLPANSSVCFLSNIPPVVNRQVMGSGQIRWSHVDSSVRGTKALVSQGYIVITDPYNSFIPVIINGGMPF